MPAETLPPPAAPAATPAPAPAPAPAAAAPATNPAPAAPPAAQPDPKAAPGSLLESAKAGDPKPGEPKPGEAPATKQGAPESYTDFKLPDGMTLDKALADKALPVFKKLNLSQEAAQELVSLQAEHAKATGEAIVAQADKMRAEQIASWQAETKKALGADWEKELGHAGRALDAFWSPEFRKLLTASGLGDHPEMALGLVKLGKMLGEAKPGEGSRAGITDPKEAQYRSMFPKMFDENGARK